MDSEDIRLIINEEEQKDLCDSFGIKLLSKIAEGSFGVVFKGLDLSDNSLCAVKVTQKNREKYSEIETSILSSLAHPNIVKFKKFCEAHSNKYIVMEYVSGGTLAELIEERKLRCKPFREVEISSIMSSLLSALKSMHENNVLHRDIKPENILMGNREDMRSLKLSDFGLSVKNQEGTRFASYSQKCGTVMFMAPEMIILEKQYSKPVDIWSCGIILYMLLTLGDHPVKVAGDTREEYTQRLANFDFSSLPARMSKFSDLAQNLVTKMIEKDPWNRYTAYQAFKHPFVTRNLTASIPLSFEENTRIFQAQRKLAEIFKAMVIVRAFQQEAAGQRSDSSKATANNNQTAPSIAATTTSNCFLKAFVLQESAGSGEGSYKGAANNSSSTDLSERGQTQQQLESVTSMQQQRRNNSRQSLRSIKFVNHSYQVRKSLRKLLRDNSSHYHSRRPAAAGGGGGTTVGTTTSHLSEDIIQPTPSSSSSSSQQYRKQFYFSPSCPSSCSSTSSGKHPPGRRQLGGERTTQSVMFSSSGNLNLSEIVGEATRAQSRASGVAKNGRSSIGSKKELVQFLPLVSNGSTAASSALQKPPIGSFNMPPAMKGTSTRLKTSANSNRVKVSSQQTSPLIEPLSYPPPSSSLMLSLKANPSSSSSSQGLTSTAGLNRRTSSYIGCRNAPLLILQQQQQTTGGTSRPPPLPSSSSTSSTASSPANFQIKKLNSPKQSEKKSGSSRNSSVCLPATKGKNEVPSTTTIPSFKSPQSVFQAATPFQQDTAAAEPSATTPHTYMSFSSHVHALEGSYSHFPNSQLSPSLSPTASLSPLASPLNNSTSSARQLVVKKTQDNFKRSQFSHQAIKDQQQLQPHHQLQPQPHQLQPQPHQQLQPQPQQPTPSPPLIHNFPHLGRHLMEARKSPAIVQDGSDGGVSTQHPKDSFTFINCEEQLRE